MPRGKKKIKRNTKTVKSNSKSTRSVSKKVAECSPESDGSPFKGFASPLRENIEPVILFEDSQDKDAAFDKLLDPPQRRSFPSKNIKTYSNKRKVEQEHRLLEFQDCKNRDNIIQWLNDNQNLFDRLTQTQRDNFNQPEDETTFDMPSVSQVNKASSSKLQNKTVRRTRRRSPYKLRARSLEIQITKNGVGGRNERHSLAGDTPSMEDYHIEEVVTDDEAPVPVAEAKLFVNLMEDECLSALEREVLSRKNEDKNNQSVNGWDRIKVMNRTIHPKQPKQLKIITLQSSLNKKGEILEHSKHLDELENHFIDKMEQLMKNDNIRSSQMTQGTTAAAVLTAGYNFVQKMRTLSDVKDNLTEFQSLFCEIKNLFNLFDIGKNTTSTASIQTVAPRKISKQVQTLLKTTSMEVQTDGFVDCKNCANNNNNKIQQSDKIVQTVINRNSIEVQTEVLISNNVLIKRNDSQTSGTDNSSDILPLSVLQKLISDQNQPQKIENSLNQTLDEVQFDTENFLEDGVTKKVVGGKSTENARQTSRTATPSDILPLSVIQKLLSGQKQCQKIENALNQTVDEVQFDKVNFVEEDNKTKKVVVENEGQTSGTATPSDIFPLSNQNKPEKTVNSLNQTLDDVQFDTEAFLKADIKTGNAVEEKSVENGAKSLLVCSVSSKPESSKGVKRVLSRSPISDEENRTKRPCNKFINEDLSVAFDSCPEEPKFQKIQVIEISDESDDTDFTEYLKNTLKKWDNNVDKIKIESPPLEIDKTQLEIEELEEKIRNATKPVKINSQQFSSDSDVILMEAEKDITKIENELDYFEAHLLEEKSTTARKRLFKSQENNTFSESLFEKMKDQSGSVTITKENVDFIMELGDSDSENDKEVQSILSEVTSKKINILQNVVVKRANHIDEEIREDIVLSGVDVVEATPEKKSSFSLHRTKESSFLDITLPPPLEFQDIEMENLDKPQRKSTPPRKLSPPRRPLTTVNKITSTPVTQRNCSELISLSPITLENNRTPGLIEAAQQAKFTPLTIVKSSQSQKNIRNSATPKQKSILNYVRPSQESQQSPNRKPCISCSRISRDQVMAISALTNRKLATYSSSFSAKVTHMVVSVNNKKRIMNHTIKSVSAIAAGIWVLDFGWVQECLDKNSIVPEEPYEVLDVSGIPGPQKSRLARATNPLLKGYKIHVSPPFLTATLQDIENIIKLLGGKVVPSPEDLLDRGGYVCLIITEGKATQDCDSEKFETWLEALRVVTVDLEWLSRSVGQYQLQSLIPFTLCSDDFIDSLGYPPELTSNVPVSFMQSTPSA